jgi:hypothetical protein
MALKPTGCAGLGATIGIARAPGGLPPGVNRLLKKLFSAEQYHR